MCPAVYFGCRVSRIKKYMGINCTSVTVVTIFEQIGQRTPRHIYKQLRETMLFRSLQEAIVGLLLLKSSTIEAMLIPLRQVLVYHWDLGCICC